MSRQPLQMQRRHFEKIAATIRLIGCPAERERTARLFGSELRGTNAKFDRDYFITAATKESRQ